MMQVVTFGGHLPLSGLGYAAFVKQCYCVSPQEGMFLSAALTYEGIFHSVLSV